MRNVTPAAGRATVAYVRALLRRTSDRIRIVHRTALHAAAVPDPARGADPTGPDPGSRVGQPCQHRDPPVPCL